MGLKDTINFLKGSKSNKKKPPEPEKKKRGQYKKQECPYCNKVVGNLANHIRMVHGDEAKREGYQVEKPDITKDDLLGTGSKADNLTPKPPIYYCTNCRAKLRKGENPCWNCGQLLNWEGIE